MDLQTATKLQQLRKEHGFSQEELADKLGVSRQAVSKWERAESSPDTDNLVCLAKLYNVSLDELLEITPNEQQIVEQASSERTQQVDVEQDEDDKEEGYSPSAMWAKILYSLLPVLCVIAYFVVSAIWELWHPAWIIFLGIPMFCSIISAIEQKRFCAFAFPIFATAVYLVMGFLWGWWHPGWIVFVLIPVYYTIAGWIDSNIHSQDESVLQEE